MQLQRGLREWEDQRSLELLGDDSSDCTDAGRTWDSKRNCDEISGSKQTILLGIE